ncbi:MAG TPA: filamentous hemagglutinin N-terminal domain-containing protein, partial [Limnobacter sp.]|uniref:two-partner secretion domain-containing protein n=1 Tax=Limnobacter sp. TaxID=2003368 RepID=UPI002E3117DC
MKNKSFKDARSFSKNPIAAAALILLTGHAQAASGLPDIGKNKLPDGISIDQSQADKLIITQGVAGGPTMNSQINWDTFRVGDQMQVRFDQPNASSVILNRVVGGQVSEILGSIQANGRIFLINPQGITFGVNSQVNVGSFVASTLGLSEKETSKDLGQIVLNGQPKGSTGILQQGSINANQIALIGAAVTNTGSLTAGTGEAGQVPKVYLIAAQKVTADTTGDYIVLTPEAGAEQALLQSLGSIDAGSGTITLIAKSDGAGGASVLNLQGIMKAGTLHTSDSGITLQADQIQQTVVDGESVKPLQATGSLDIQANQIDLGNAGNQISGDVSVVGASNVTLQSTSGLSVNRIQAAGDVDLVSGADLGLSGNLNVGGSLAVTAVGQLTEANGAAVTVTGSSTLKAKSVSL